MKYWCMSFKNNLLALLLTICSSGISFAQSGWNIQAGGGGGVSVIAAQNDFGNDFYELDYKTSLGYTANIGAGYNFKRNIGLFLEGGITNVNQDYKGKFSPGLGFVGKGEHTKDVSLMYYNIGIHSKFTISFVDDYVYDSKLQGFAMVGFQANMLGKASLTYMLDGNEEPYPSKIRPYVDENYPYSPVTNDKDLFTKATMSFSMQLGLDWFIADKIALSPSIIGQASLFDINNKNFRNETNYKKSRYFFGGLHLGIGYYFNRG